MATSRWSLVFGTVLTVCSLGVLAGGAEAAPRPIERAAAVPARSTWDPFVSQKLRECGQIVVRSLSIASALSPSGKIKAALGAAACSIAAGSVLGMTAATAICRATYFWGPFGATPRWFVRTVTGGQYDRC